MESSRSSVILFVSVASSRKSRETWAASRPERLCVVRDRLVLLLYSAYYSVWWLPLAVQLGVSACLRVEFLFYSSASHTQQQPGRDRIALSSVLKGQSDAHSITRTPRHARDVTARPGIPWQRRLAPSQTDGTGAAPPAQPDRFIHSFGAFFVGFHSGAVFRKTRDRLLDSEQRRGVFPCDRLFLAGGVLPPDAILPQEDRYSITVLGLDLVDYK